MKESPIIKMVYLNINNEINFDSLEEAYAAINKSMKLAKRKHILETDGKPFWRTVPKERHHFTKNYHI